MNAEARFFQNSERAENIPQEFTLVKDLNKNFGKVEEKGLETIKEYAKEGLRVPKMKEFSQNNGAIAIVDEQGNIRVMLPLVSRERQEENSKRLERILKKLKEMGYTESSFMVPFSS